MEASGYERRIGRYGGALAGALIRVAGVSRDAEVLDVGSGTGGEWRLERCDAPRDPAVQ